MIYLHIVQLIKYNFEFLTLTQTLTQKSTKKAMLYLNKTFWRFFYV